MKDEFQMQKLLNCGFLNVSSPTCSLTRQSKPLLSNIRVWNQGDSAERPNEARSAAEEHQGASVTVLLPVSTTLIVRKLPGLSQEDSKAPSKWLARPFHPAQLLFHDIPTRFHLKTLAAPMCGLLMVEGPSCLSWCFMPFFPPRIWNKTLINWKVHFEPTGMKLLGKIFVFHAW